MKNIKFDVKFFGDRSTVLWVYGDSGIPPKLEVFSVDWFTSSAKHKHKRHVTRGIIEKYQTFYLSFTLLNINVNITYDFNFERREATDSEIELHDDIISIFKE